MSEPYKPISPVEVEDSIRRTLRDLRHSVESTEKIAVEAARAEHAYKVGQAKARMRYRAEHVKATTTAVDDAALVEVEEEHLAHLVASHTLTARREANRALQARLDGLRTLASNLRGVVT